MSELPSDQRAPTDATVGFGDVPLLLFIRGLFLVLVVVWMVLGLHYYLGVRLIRGTSCNQPEGVDHVLVTSGVGVPTGAVIFGQP